MDFTRMFVCQFEKFRLAWLVSVLLVCLSILKFQLLMGYGRLNHVSQIIV